MSLDARDDKLNPTVGLLTSLSFEVKAPSGRWIVAKPAGTMKEADAPKPITLKPGEAYVQAMRLDRWTAYTPIPKDGTYPPNVFWYCDQLVISTGLLRGPISAKPTNAATDVPTPSIGRLPGGVSSTYTPGVR